MQKLEIIFSGLFIFGSILKMCHIPGSAFLIVVSFLFLFIIYTYLPYYLINNKSLKDIFKKSTYMGTGVYKTLVSIFTGWALGCFVAGVTFGIMSYNGGLLLLVSGQAWMTVSVLVLFLGMKRHKKFVIRNLIRISVIAVVGNLLVQLSVVI